MSGLEKTISTCFENKRALIAFNVQSISQIYILEELSKTMNAPVIAQMSQKYVPLFDRMIGLENVVKRYQSDLLTFHLDHCDDKETISYCIQSGFASVMYDGSHHPIEENIKNTNEIYALAKKSNCLLEAELGSIGGVEDGFGTDELDVYSEDELLMFAKETSYDLLALAIGNAHGYYKTVTEIDVNLLKRAADLIGQQYFVLHGGTGMPDEMVSRAVDFGVIKINVSTALKVKYLKTLEQFVVSQKEYNESAFLEFLKEDLSDLYKEYIEKFTL